VKSAEQRGAEAPAQDRVTLLERRFDALIKAVIPIGVALLATRDFQRMLETILLEAKALCHADGGTLYLRTDDDQLRFVMLRNDSLGIAMGGTSGGEIPYPPLPLRDPASGAPNHRNVATWAALTGQSVNFDQLSGYRSTSFLTVPLKNAAQRVIGVLQLLNATDPASGAVVAFDPGDVPVVEALSTLAAAALDVYMREEGLRSQIRALHIEIDEAKRARQVAEITDSDYFRSLQQKVRVLRSRVG
jgi:GAF domain-containing protein